MLKLTTLLLFVLYFSAAFSQNVIEGKIYDEILKREVTYAKVRVQNTNKGVLTNENGNFQIVCASTDSLIISHPLYEKITIESAYFNDNDTLFVNQGFQEIEEVTAVGLKKDSWIDLFREARKKLTKTKEFESKAYFSIESSADDNPIELIEAYYNASANSNGPKKLELKNGRIGLSESGGEYFVSMNTTEILSNYNLLYSKNVGLPMNPLQLSKKNVNKYYNIELVSIENGLHKLHLKSIEGNPKGQLFDAVVWINRSDTTISRVELKKSQLRVLPFVEINEGDIIESANFWLAYNFYNEPSKVRLQGIEFDYNFLYTSQTATRKINSSGVLMFYDEDDLFVLPKFENNSKAISDYDKIVSQPYNDFFWKHNKLMILSENELRYTQYFQENGVLLNFSDLVEINPIFKNKFIHWDRKRIFLDQINGDFDSGASSSSLYDYHSLASFSDLYELDASIFLDQNRHGDSIHFLVKTIINLDESFYHLERNEYTVCLVNMYFDLVEVHRRKLESVLKERNWTVAQVDSIYKATKAKLEEGLKKFLLGVEHGANHAKIQLYSKYLEEELSLDNSLLIESEGLKFKMNSDELQLKDDVILRYSYGSALMKIEQYEEALAVLLDAEMMSAGQPLIYHNIGICYLELGQEELGCLYLSKSQELGVKLEQSIRVQCSSYE